MAEIHRLADRENFVDDRGVGLRVTWHPEQSVVVLSVWHGESCAGTFRLPVADAARLAHLLLASVTDWASMVEAQTALPAERRDHRSM